ncbi:MAG: hypothetical protein J1F32_00715 [Erysipelotrichales bacterium]|nr:hypothetical protein [Erysipelotrichales bacterium]
MSINRKELLKTGLAIEKTGANKKAAAAFYRKFIESHPFFKMYSTMFSNNINNEISKVSSLKDTLLFENHLKAVNEIYIFCEKNPTNIYMKLKDLSFEKRNEVQRVFYEIDINNKRKWW